MTIKLLPGNPCNRATVFLSGDDFLQLGITSADLTLQNRKTRQLLGVFFNMLWEFAGLRRDGNYIAVICRPLKKGGCRFYIQFTREPSGRLFRFGETDDLLDAVSQLRGHTALDLSEIEISPSDGDYQIYIPAGLRLSPHALAVLSEYSV